MPLARGDGSSWLRDDFLHQKKLVEETLDRRGWAVFWEMGCGKTRPTIQTCAILYDRAELDGVIVVAPNGVHRNWVSDELPRHCHVPWRALDWHSSKSATKAQRADEDALLLRGAMRVPYEMPVLSITYEGMLTKRGRQIVDDFTRRFPRYAFIVDEGARVKNPTAERTKACKRVARGAELVRILNGTPVANAPLDVYSQMILIDESFWIKRGVGSYTAFKARFAVTKEIVVAAPSDPTQGRLEPPAPATDVVQTTLDDVLAFEAGGDLEIAGESVDASLAGDVAEGLVTPAAATPIETESQGRTIKVIVGYRDLESLKSMIASMSSRLTKEDAGLDLPPKLYNRIPFELSPEQRRAYDKLRTEYMLELDNGALVTAAIAMVRILRLQQVACGYLPNPDDPGGEPIMLCGKDKDDPRLDHLLELLEDVPGKAIIWARFRLDVDRIVGKLGAAAVRYDGAVTSPRDRAAAIDRFRRDASVHYFVANPAAIGMGVTLTEATNTIYYSNSFSLTDRLQSEDRNHRIGQRNSVTYHDLVAERTVDERIIAALRRKQEIAAQVTGDELRAWLA